MNILLYLFTLFFEIIKSIINIHYYIFKKIRKNYFDKNYYNHEIYNLFSLILKIIFLSIYEFLVFHIFVFIFLIHDSSIKFGYFGIILRLILTISVSIILSFISGEIHHIFHYLFQLIISILHLFTWMNSLLFYVLTFNEEIKDIIIFKKQFDGLQGFLRIYIIVFVQIYKFILIMIHFSNPFSIIRIIEISKNKKERDSTSLLSKSFTYIFFDIFVLTPAYIFIMLLFPVFISTNVNIYKIICNKGIDKNAPNFFPKYNIIKNQIINDMIKVLIYIIAITLTILSVLFIWKINKSIKILIELFKTNEYKKFFFDYYDHIINCLTQIIKIGLTIFIYIIAIILTILSFPFIWKLNKSLNILIELFKTNEYKKFFINYFYNIINAFNQMIKVGLIIIIFFFMILLFIIISPFIWKLNKSLKIFIELFKTKEYLKFFNEYFHNLIDCLIETALSIPVILNHILPIHLKALNDSYYSNKNKLKKKRKYIYINLTIFIEKWLDIFAFVISMPRLITINFYIYLIRKNSNIHLFNLLFDNEYLQKNQSNNYNRYNSIKQLFFDPLVSFLMILQILLGILNPFFSLKIINDIYLYFITCKSQIQLDFLEIELKFIAKSCKSIFALIFFTLIYMPISLILNVLAPWTIKHNINLFISINKKTINKLKNNNKVRKEYTRKIKFSFRISNYFENVLLMFNSLIDGYILIFELFIIHLTIFRIFFFWGKFKKSDKATFVNLVKNQFSYAILEFFYTPFLFVIIILNPWNYGLILTFFEEKDCESKFNKFKTIIITFMKDITLAIILILLLVTLIDTIPTILLIIRTIKRKIFPTEENKLTYNLNYKPEDFRTELRQIYNKNVKKNNNNSSFYF